MGLSQRSTISDTENVLTRALRERLARGHAPLDLTSSNPAAVGLTHAASDLTAALAQPPVEHTPDPWGAAKARTAVCAYLAGEGIASEPSRTLLTSSTSEAYGLLFKLLCDPGDRILAPVPSYPLFEQLARLEGVELAPYPLRYDGRWHIDLPALREAARDARVRAVLLVSPNNPTGNRATRAELEALAETGLPLISDEVFAEYVLTREPEAAASALDVTSPNLIFRMGGLSKSALLPQAKLAWTTLQGPAALCDEAAARLEHLADAYLSPSAFVQAAAGTLLANAAPLREQLRERLRNNVDCLARHSAGSPVSLLHVEAGWYGLLRMPAVLDEDAWALRLLDADVRVQPGYFYELPEGPHLVVSLLTPPHVLERGMRRLLDVVETACT